MIYLLLAIMFLQSPTLPPVETKSACYYMINDIQPLPHNKRKISIEYQCDEPYRILLISRSTGIGQRNLIVSDHPTSSIKKMTFTITEQEFLSQILKINKIKF